MGKNHGAKGTAFERRIAKELSLWWSEGERDDLIWRTSGSGARATTRAKSKKQTSGHYGDLTFTDPIAKPLFDIISFELKCGYNSKTLADLVDASERAKEQMWAEWILKAQRACKNSGSFSWAIISMRARRETLLTIPHELFQKLPFGGYVSPRLRLEVEIGLQLVRVHQMHLSQLFDLDPGFLRIADK